MCPYTPSATSASVRTPAPRTSLPHLTTPTPRSPLPRPAGWLLFWLRSQFILSQALVALNTLAHLSAVFFLPVLSTSSALQSRTPARALL